MQGLSVTFTTASAGGVYGLFGRGPNAGDTFGPVTVLARLNRDWFVWYDPAHDRPR